MTIDEAITTEIEYSQPCDIICKDGADCNDCRSYHRQLAECLEELKQYRTIGTVEECCESAEKQTAKKPEFVDTRFMNNGKHISDGCQLQKCYKCPNCNQHIFHVWDDELYCKYCGQHIDWSDGDDGN